MRIQIPGKPSTTHVQDTPCSLADPGGCCIQEGGCGLSGHNQGGAASQDWEGIQALDGSKASWSQRMGAESLESDGDLLDLRGQKVGNEAAVKDRV